MVWLCCACMPMCMFLPLLVNPTAISPGGHISQPAADELSKPQVVESAKACLKMNGKFCGFSPCIEQVQRTAEALRDAEFCDVRCIECILRYHDVRTENFALPYGPAAAVGAGDRKRTASEAGLEPVDSPADPPGPVEGDAVANAGRGNSNGRSRAAAGKKDDSQGRVKERRLGRHCPLYVPWMSEHVSVRRTVTLPRHVARGHTGYLLFARKPVKAADHRLDAGEGKGGNAAQGGAREAGEGAGDEAGKAQPESANDCADAS